MKWVFDLGHSPKTNLSCGRIHFLGCISKLAPARKSVRLSSPSNNRVICPFPISGQRYQMLARRRGAGSCTA